MAPSDVRQTRAELASLEEELTSHEADIRQLLDELPDAAPDRRKELISTVAQLEGIMENHQSKIDSVLSGHLKSGQSEARERQQALHARCEKLREDLELAFMQALRDVELVSLEEAALPQKHLDKMKSEPQAEREHSKNWRNCRTIAWRSRAEQQDRAHQLEISPRREESQRHMEKLNKMEHDLSLQREHSENWRGYSEQQSRDMQRELQMETARRRRYEQAIYSASPEPYQVQIDELTSQLTIQKEQYKLYVEEKCIEMAIQHKNEMNQLKRTLQDVKQRCDELRVHSQEQDRQLQQAAQGAVTARSRHDREVSQLRSELQNALDDVNAWRKQAQKHEGEACRLREQVQELKKQGSRRPGGGGILSFEQLASQVAEFECRPLEKMSPEARQGFKKKLLIKWHPDKQPSADNVSFATCVMQALQNRPEWS